MPKFSKKSLQRLSECDERLQILFRMIVRTFDCTILTGHRTKEEQNAAFRAGRSKLRFPASKR